MSDCLITGMPNVGKTCFVINFAEYMGLQNLKFHVRQVAGYISVRNYSPGEARDELISQEKNYTRDIQSIKLEIPVGKVFKELEIIDSIGLCSGIHPEAELRMAMAQTIRLMRESKLILHLIDISTINSRAEELLEPIDRMIMNYASLEKDYAILANKIDLLLTDDNLKELRSRYGSRQIIPISALYQQGFRDVKRLVLNYV